MVSLPAGKQTSAEAVIAKRQQLEANLALPGKLRLAVGPQANELIVRMQNTSAGAGKGKLAARRCRKSANLSGG
ncbi:hypothetical protein [Streptomyces scopuliridis]|uniref:hypothetical protein n=1 Tax=Streptomyces scopuliridis TaxID=452529 RepID=UPI003696910D